VINTADLLETGLTLLDLGHYNIKVHAIQRRMKEWTARLCTRRAMLAI